MEELDVQLVSLGRWDALDNCVEQNDRQSAEQGVLYTMRCCMADTSSDAMASRLAFVVWMIK